FTLIGLPARRGDLYVQRALDPNAIAYRLVIDERTGRMVSVRPLPAPGPFAYGPGPYGPYPPPYRRAYGRYFGPQPEEYGYGYGRPNPPRNVPTARLSPPKTQPQSQPQPDQPSQQSHQLPPLQPSTTAQAPLPRPKPYVMEATGSIPVDSQKALASQMTPDPQKAPTPPAVAPQSNGAVALPPVAPLD